MRGLADIPVRIARHAAPDTAPSPQVGALLQELHALITALQTTEKGGTIDIRSYPLSPQDREQLYLILGEGEVSARIDALGPSEIQETRIPGIWRVTHYNEHRSMLTEHVVVTRIPDILMTDPRDLSSSLDQLTRLLDP